MINSPIYGQTKFDINLVNAVFSTSDNQKKIDKATYDEVEQYVKKKMTDVTGTPEEVQEHNIVLAKCVIGDPNAQIQVKYKIKQYAEQLNLVPKDSLDQVVEQIYRDSYGLGAIDDLLNDGSISEIWVNGYQHVWIEKGGIRKRLNRKFKSDDEVIRVMNQMLQFDKKSITTQKPTIESKLRDGSRITFSIPPVSSRPQMSIRRFEAFEISEENVLNTKTISREMLDFLKIAINGRTNMLIIGETGSGKTSFLKFLCDYIKPDLRIGTIESNFELKLSDKYPNRNIFEYEEHENLGRGLGELFRLCLRSSPDIILVGEMRSSDETEQFLKACRRGHPGSLGTIHTNGPDTTVDDMMEMILEDGKKREPALLIHRITSAIELIIQSHRFDETGERKIINISEIIPSSDMNQYGHYEINTIFTFNQKTNQFERVGKIKNPKLIEKMKFFGVEDKELQIA